MTEPITAATYTLSERLRCVEVMKHDLQTLQLDYEDLRAMLAALVVVCTRGALMTLPDLLVQHRRSWAHMAQHPATKAPRWIERAFRVQIVRQVLLARVELSADPSEQLAEWAGLALGTLTSLTFGIHTETDNEALVLKAWHGSSSEVAS